MTFLKSQGWHVSFSQSKFLADIFMEQSNEHTVRSEETLSFSIMVTKHSSCHPTNLNNALFSNSTMGLRLSAKNGYIQISKTMLHMHT